MLRHRAYGPTTAIPGRRCTTILPRNPSLLEVAFLHDQDSDLPSAEACLPWLGSHKLGREITATRCWTKEATLCAGEPLLPPLTWFWRRYGSEG
jgi:hypothetical protein